MKTKTQISFPVTAKPISSFVSATLIAQSFYWLNTKLQTSSYNLFLYSPVCVGPDRKPRRLVFSERGPYVIETEIKSVTFYNSMLGSRRSTIFMLFYKIKLTMMNLIYLSSNSNSSKFSLNTGSKSFMIRSGALNKYGMNKNI